MDEKRVVRRQKKTFPDARKVGDYGLLQHLLPPSLLSLAGPFLKVVIVNHRSRNFVNFPEIASGGFSVTIF